MQYPVREGGVKEIAGPRGVHHPDLIRGSIPEAGAIPSECAINSDRGANSARAVFPLELGERFEEILFFGGVDGELLRGDGVVDEGKKTQQSRGHVIQVGYNGDARGARPRGGDACGCGVVTVDVQEPGGSDPASLEKSWRDGEAGIAPPDDGTFAGTGVNQDEGHLAQRARRLDEIGVDTGAAEFATVQVSSMVVPNDSNIMSAESPTLAGDEGCGDLAAGHDLRAEHFQFGTQGRELGELQNCVGGVLADTQDVETLSAHEVVVQGIGIAQKCKEY